MKYPIFSLLFVLSLLMSIPSHAHFVWIETATNGQLNQSQDIKIFFGEFSYGKYESAEGRSFSKIKDFSLEVCHTDGSKVPLEVTPNGNHFLAQFKPEKEGTYTVILNHDKIPVYDLTKYGHGIFKAHYHATAKIQVGETMNHTLVNNPNSISIKNRSEKKDEYVLEILYKGQPLANTEIALLANDQWNKTITTDENGLVSFKLPWKSTFVVEATFRDDTKGVYLNTEYDYLWHCCTLTIKNE